MRFACSSNYPFAMFHSRCSITTKTPHSLWVSRLQKLMVTRVLGVRGDFRHDNSSRCYSNSKLSFPNFSNSAGLSCPNLRNLSCSNFSNSASLSCQHHPLLPNLSFPTFRCPHRHCGMCWFLGATNTSWRGKQKRIMTLLLCEV